MMKVELHSQENKKNYRWLMVVNCIENNVHHRDFQYFRFKFQMILSKFMASMFWGEYFGSSMWIQTYDMHNLKKWEVSKMTKELIDSGYFNEFNNRVNTGEQKDDKH